MNVRRWFGTVALGVAMAMSSPAFAQGAGGDTSKTQKSGQKTATSKGAGKSGKSGKSGGKSVGGGESVDATTDSWIAMKLKTDLTNDASLKGSDITVETKDKVVTLKGTVASDAAKTRAEQIAKATQGVTKVIDNLAIRAK